MSARESGYVCVVKGFKVESEFEGGKNKKCRGCSLNDSESKRFQMDQYSKGESVECK